jgi:competence protein ComEA
MKRFLLILVAIASLACTASPLLAEEPVSSAAPAAKESAAIANLTNVNTASAKELEKLPGIGNKSAAAIVAYRTEKGKFKTLKDLLKVNGVGKKTLEKIQPLIRFE